MVQKLEEFVLIYSLFISSSSLVRTKKDQWLPSNSKLCKNVNLPNQDQTTKKA